MLKNNSKKFKIKVLRGVVSVFVGFCFLLNIVFPASISFAQSQILATPVLGATVLVPAIGEMAQASSVFQPAVMRGIKLFEDNPLHFNFIIDSGDSPMKEYVEFDIESSNVESETEKLIKYFLVALTIPDEDFWVNLSPKEKDRIIPYRFGQTEMGRDFLAQDYLLKQITASLMSPDSDLGEKFWFTVQEKAYELYGTRDVPSESISKVWIVPQEAVVYENVDSAFVVESSLKVMLEEDYLASDYDGDLGVDFARDQSIDSEIIREIILPELEREVNQGKNFAPLRQIYNSLILATWYKRKLKDYADTVGQEPIMRQVYVGKSKVEGVDLKDKSIKEKIYNQYLESFKRGVYEVIKEEYDPATQQIIPRKYFSGGFGFKGVDPAMLIVKDESFGQKVMDEMKDKAVLVDADLTPKQESYDNDLSIENPAIDEFNASSLWIEMKEWKTDEQVEYVSQQYDADEQKAAISEEIPVPSSLFPVKRILTNSLNLIGGDLRIPQDLNGLDVAIVGPSGETHEIEQFLDSYSNIKTLHLIDVGSDVFQRLEANLGELLKEKNIDVKFYGYRASVLDLPEQLKGKIDLLYNAFVFLQPYFSDGQLSQIGKEVSSILKPGGVHVSVGEPYFPDFYNKENMIFYGEPEQTGARVYAKKSSDKAMLDVSQKDVSLLDIGTRSIATTLPSNEQERFNKNATYIVEENSQTGEMELRETTAPEEGFHVMQTSLSGLRAKLEFDPLRYIYSYLEDNPGKVMKVLDLGVGDGSGWLDDVAIALKRDGLLDRVELIGYGNLYMPQWRFSQENLSFVLDDFSNIRKHINDGEIDLVISSISMYHIKGQEHMLLLEDISRIMSLQGQLIYDYDPYKLESLFDDANNIGLKVMRDSEELIDDTYRVIHFEKTTDEAMLDVDDIDSISVEDIMAPVSKILYGSSIEMNPGAMVELRSFIANYLDVLKEYSFRKRVYREKILDPEKIAEVFYLSQSNGFYIFDFIEKGVAQFAVNDGGESQSYEIRLVGEDHLEVYNISESEKILAGKTYEKNETEEEDYYNIYNSDGYENKGLDLGNFMIKVKNFLLWARGHSFRSFLMDSKSLVELSKYYESIGGNVDKDFERTHGVSFELVGGLSSGVLSVEQAERIKGLDSRVWRVWSQMKRDRYFEGTAGIDNDLLVKANEEFSNSDIFDEHYQRRGVDGLRTISPEEVTGFVEKAVKGGSDRTDDAMLSNVREGQILYELVYDDIDNDTYGKDFNDGWAATQKEYNEVLSRYTNNKDIIGLVGSSLNAFIENSLYEVLIKREKYAREGLVYTGKVSAQLIVRSGELVLNVKDNAGGINRARLEMLGDYVFQSKYKRDRSELMGFLSGGYGVALKSLVKTVKEKFDGYLSVDTNHRGEKFKSFVEGDESDIVLMGDRNEEGTDMSLHIPVEYSDAAMLTNVAEGEELFRIVFDDIKGNDYGKVFDAKWSVFQKEFHREMKQFVPDADLASAIGGTMHAFLENSVYEIMIKMRKLGKSNPDYEGKVSAVVKFENGELVLVVEDNASGINQYRLGLIGTENLKSKEKRDRSDGFGFNAGGHGHAIKGMLARYKERFNAYIEIDTNQNGVKKSSKIFGPGEVIVSDGDREEEGTTIAMHFSVESDSKGDKAMLNNFTKGGIDFGSKRLNVEVRSKQGEPVFRFDSQELISMNISGFEPVIVDILPSVNLPALLGLQ